MGWQGRHVGTQFGEQSADWYARNYLGAKTWYGKAGYYTGGLFASLWTPESWKKTATVIIAAHLADEYLVKGAGRFAHYEHMRGPHKYPHLQIGNKRLRVPKKVIQFFRKPIKARKLLRKAWYYIRTASAGSGGG